MRSSRWYTCKTSFVGDAHPVEVDIELGGPLSPLDRADPITAALQHGQKCSVLKMTQIEAVRCAVKGGGAHAKPVMSRQEAMRLMLSSHVQRKRNYNS